MVRVLLYMVLFDLAYAGRIKMGTVAQEVALSFWRAGMLVYLIGVRLLRENPGSCLVKLTVYGGTVAEPYHIMHIVKNSFLFSSATCRGCARDQLWNSHAMVMRRQGFSICFFMPVYLCCQIEVPVIVQIEERFILRLWGVLELLFFNCTRLYSVVDWLHSVRT